MQPVGRGIAHRGYTSLTFWSASGILFFVGTLPTGTYQAPLWDYQTLAGRCPGDTRNMVQYEQIESVSATLSIVFA